MKCKKSLFVLFLILICCISCEKDNHNEEAQSVSIDKITVENGRISFPNKDAFF